MRNQLYRSDHGEAQVHANDVVFDSNRTRRRLQTCVGGARLIWLETAGHGLTDQTTAVGEFLSSNTLGLYNER